MLTHTQRNLQRFTTEIYCVDITLYAVIFFMANSLFQNFHFLATQVCLCAPDYSFNMMGSAEYEVTEISTVTQSTYQETVTVEANLIQMLGSHL
jgi:hypothetical protein